ncbi:MAG TPA: hypothetical protein VM802_14390 [Chitinophaga sp.]|uniref:hypothetical protein n=1 Tax=Chitinophaga sp. TaxID=1869181 RepID=UPI002D0C455A|nr:hypothetical protein [Chitinophaga sp.]HVI46061.1 hypothetical protein [Chitinophaga sp.]
MRSLLTVTMLTCGLGLLISISAHSQSRATALDTLEMRYQQCLTSNHNMYNCALNYYKQLDSLLYNTLQYIYSHIDTNKQYQLQTDQGAWEARKEEYFKKIDERVEKLHKSTLAGLNDDMISTDNKAAFLKDRLSLLFKDFTI